MWLIEEGPDAARRALVEERLRASNDERSPLLAAARQRGETEAVPLELWAIDDDVLVAGLVGVTRLGWLTVDLLWVHADQRGEGFGSRLLEQAEQMARDDRGCIGARLETWDFQARPFYERHGYEVFGVLEDHPAGVTEYHMAKRLDR
jgi:GNAT superfamily N-acetyltransferase